jgi:siroheme synthase-like protein
MGFYPLALELGGRRCVVVGGGPVAERRVEALLQAGAEVTIVSPTLTPTLAALRDAGRVRQVARVYEPGDLAGAVLAFTAVDDPTVSAVVAREAFERGVWLNAADQPAYCDFILPGIVRRGVLTVAVTSGGTSPALTRALREHLDATLGPEWTALGALAASARLELRTTGRAPTAETWRRALGPDVRAALAEGREADARARLRAHLELPA